MPLYTLTWTETVHHTGTVEADSESAARQAWIDDALEDVHRVTDLPGTTRLLSVEVLDG